ncbi:MAG: hypothetical protein M3444_17705 [Acidobacteriota bacterium]|nr:hypothetical protein [Acidobacteriota bacterium]MDQ5835967.1 hypothetical protein [Acidobacteriota bacterium]
MKRILSLALAITISSLGLISLPARTARAQEVASAGKSIAELTEEYERLLAIERDPSTPTEAREMNRTFLEARRAQLRAALTARLGALRKYRAGTAAMLTEKEQGVLDNAIRDLDAQLASLPTEARKEAPATAQQAGRARVVNTAAEQAEASATESASAPRFDDPIVVSSPAADTSIGVDKVEIEITVNDDAIDDVTVDVYEGDSTKPFGERTLDIKRSDKGKKKVGVSLHKGVNRIEVTSKEKADAKAVRKITYATSEPVTIGSPGGDGGSAGGAAITTSTKWTNVPEEGQNVNVGYQAESGKLYQFFRRKRDGATENVGSPMTPGIAGTVAQVFPELQAGDRVGIVQVESGQPVDATRDFIGVEPALDITKGGPVGLLFGGAVISQQNQEFQQADPFFGFIAGYDFKVHHAHTIQWLACGDDKYMEVSDGTFVNEKGYLVKCVPKNPENRAAGMVLKYTSDGHNYEAWSEDKTFIKNLSPPKLYGGWKALRMHLRFQGIFQADARATTATATASPSPTPITTGVGANNEPTFTFLASRKTFDIETHGWLDLYANNKFTIGPYAAFGASTVLSKRELSGEIVTNNNATPSATPAATPAATPTATPAATPSTTTPTTGTPTPTQSENDMKKYYEFGFLSNTHLFDNKLFIQSILAYGRYEAFAGLSNKKPGCSFWCDSQNRFVGKLRIFPGGLNLGFGRQIVAAPMFGVDLNAGRGPDYLKFFTGFAIKIKGFDVSGASPPK